MAHATDTAALKEGRTGIIEKIIFMFILTYNESIHLFNHCKHNLTYINISITNYFKSKAYPLA